MRRLTPRQLLDRFSRPTIARACLLLGDEWSGCDRVAWLYPDFVLAEPWNPGRMAEAERRLAAGEKAPPIRVVGFRLNSRWRFYEPSDGIHRSVAARRAGRRVKARIEGFYQVLPGRFRLDGDRLFRSDRLVSPVSAEEQTALRALGV